jgi:hypothetical protein
MSLVEVRGALATSLETCDRSGGFEARCARTSTTEMRPDTSTSEVRLDQKDASSRSIRSRVMPSAMARSEEIFGRLVCAKNCAAATLPS